MHRPPSTVRRLRSLRHLPLLRGLIPLVVGLLGTAGAAVAQDGWQERPGAGHVAAIFRNPALRESSGVAVSRRQPGVLWTIDDSGNPPWLFATDTLGTDRGTFRVAGARNHDWEAIALGPCGASDCLYIADTGDNFERRTSVRLYRVAEPDLEAARGRSPQAGPATAIEVRYPDGAHDVESLFVDAAGDTYLVGKGLVGTVRLYRVRASAWRSGSATAESLGALPIDTGRRLGRLVTDATLAPGGREVAIRTYREIFFFQRLPDGHLRPAPGQPVCSVAGLEVQGEGVAYLDARTLVLTSEAGYGRPGTISVVRCPRA
jgi:hypothetical protein